MNRLCAPFTLLRSRGVSVSHAVSLDELADVASPDRERLVELVAARLGWRTEKVAAPRPGGRDRAGSRYLRALLDFHLGGVAAATVARRLGVTRPAPGEALEGLRRRGLVERRPDKAYAPPPPASAQRATRCGAGGADRGRPLGGRDRAPLRPAECARQCPHGNAIDPAPPSRPAQCLSPSGSM